MSNLSDLLPAGASGKTIEAVATATIASKAPVILNSAGTVTEVVSSGETAVIPEGAVATFIAAPTGPPWSTATYLDSAFDVSSNKFVVVFRNAKNSDYLNYVVGTVSGSTITYGTVTTLNSATTVYPSVAADPSNSGTFVFGYNNFSTAISYVRIGTLSGTTLTFGTAVQVVASNQNIVVEFDATSSTFVAVYNWSGGSPANSWYANACTYSGTTVTLGAQTQISASVIDDTGLRGVSFDPNTSGKFTAVAREAASPFAGWAICCTISGTTITAGTVQSFIATQAGYPDVAYDATTADTLSIIFSDVASSSYATAIAATLSGTVFTFGTKAVVVSSDSDTFNLMAPTGVAGTFQAVYRNDGSGDSPYSVAFTVSSSVVTGGTNTQISTDAQGANNYLTASMNPADTGGFVTAWNETAIDNASKAVYSQAGYTSSNLTATNFVGIADAGISTSATGTIVVQGGTVTGANAILPQTTTFGSESVFESAATAWVSATYDSDSNRIVAAYRDDGNSSYGTAAVGTVSGTSISWGTPVVFDTGGNYISVTFDSDSNKVVIAYQDYANSSYGTAIVGTVSGTSISFGTAVVFESAASNYVSATFDSTANKVVIAYKDVGNSGHGTAIVGTVSGTAISYGSPVVFEAATTGYISAVYDSNADRTVISYMDDDNSDYGTSIVGTVSGTAISFGTAVVFNAFEAVYIASTYDSTAQKVVISYMDGGSTPSNQGTAIVGTVSGTTISFGTEVIFNAESSNYMGMTYDANANQVVIGYQETSKGYLILGTTSGTSISFGTAVVFNSIDTGYISPVYNSTDNKIVIAYKDTGNSDYGTGIVGTIGDGTFTTGSKYYVQDDGTITTVSSSVNAGLAISTTSLLLNGDS